MKLTLDTNILISATFWQGASDRILKLVESKEIELIISEEILKEFSQVLYYKEIQDKIKGKNLELRRSIDKLAEISKIIHPEVKIKIISEDPSDNKVLECALEGRVDYIISKDKHLLKLKEFQGIKILSPEEFLKIIDKDKSF